MLECSVPLNDCDNILVRGVNWIGDAVMTIPALRSLRRSVPGGRISLLVRPWVAPLFQCDPTIDELILYGEGHRGLFGRLDLARELRRRRFCTAILFQNAFDAAVITFLAGIPRRIGYARDGRGLLLHTAVPCDKSVRGMHHIDYYVNLLKEAGFPAQRIPPWIFLSPAERMAARAALAGLRRPVIGINPGATYGSSKRWGSQRFSEVIRMITSVLGGSAVILGGPSETGIAGEIEGGLAREVDAGRIMNMAGRTSLRELCAVISECDALVTNDSGPMHIGYAVGTPLVAIFGSTSPELTGPPAEGSAVIRKEVPCGPCFERECPKGDLGCMVRIEPEEVYSALSGLLGRRRAVFFDRDGTLCRDAHFLSRMEDLHIFPGIRSLAALKDRGLLLIGVSNQSGIGRGILKDDFVRQVNDIFIREHGFDAFYYCPHHPDDHCDCRKPEPGLLCRARNAFGVDLKGSFVVGDKEADMRLAKAVGAVGIQVRTGPEGIAPSADVVAVDLAEAVEIIGRRL